MFSFYEDKTWKNVVYCTNPDFFKIGNYDTTHNWVLQDVHAKISCTFDILLGK